MSVAVEEREGVAIVKLDRPPANALDARLVDELRAAVRQGASARALLLTSALPTMFSAGWDLPSVAAYDRPSMAGFLDSFCELVREIFAFGAPVVAALPGHAIAGGLILAAAADERLAARGSAQMGLSEVLLGVPIPRCCLEIFRHAIGDRATERLAATGENHSVEGAVELGLVDRAVERETLLDRAWERARSLADRPATAHAEIKRFARGQALRRYDQARNEDPFLDFWFGDSARQRVAQLVAKLQKK